MKIDFNTYELVELLEYFSVHTPEFVDEMKTMVGKTNTYEDKYISSAYLKIHKTYYQEIVKEIKDEVRLGKSAFAKWYKQNQEKEKLESEVK